MKIVLDAMGSDQYPEPELVAAVTSAETYGEEILLVGKESLLAPRLAVTSLAIVLVNAVQEANAPKA